MSFFEHIVSILTIIVVLISRCGRIHAGLNGPLSRPDDAISEADIVSESNNENSDLDTADLEQEEDVENEQNLQCAQDFNSNVYKILKYAFRDNITSERETRQETDVDPDELVQSMLNLETSQILGPVLKIFGSALSNNATAIDENYNKLPYAVRYQVTDFIKFAVDLLQTT